LRRENMPGTCYMGIASNSLGCGLPYEQSDLPAPLHSASTPKPDLHDAGFEFQEHPHHLRITLKKRVHALYPEI
jgi:hypothetical protein